MDNLYVGDTIKHISKANVKSIAIPIPSLEQQNAIVEYCEMNDNNIRQLEKEIEDKKAHIQQYIKDYYK
jgi:restriction endonuclease S subunit